MARRIAKKIQEIHVGHLKTDEQTVEVDNPYHQKQYRNTIANPKKITAIMNANDNPIAIMHKRKHITDPQKKAADKFYYYWSISLGGQNMGLDYRRQKVDGGRFGSHEMVKPIEAKQELDHARNKLGVMGYELVERVAGHGTPVSHLCLNKRRQNHHFQSLGECLDVLAELWGYAPPRKKYYG